MKHKRIRCATSDIFDSSHPIRRTLIRFNWQAEVTAVQFANRLAPILRTTCRSRSTLGSGEIHPASKQQGHCQLAAQAREGHFFAEVLESGSHRQSLKMLRSHGADVAAIDCVAFALLGQVSPAEVAGLRIIYKTVPVPAPPYVTSVHTPVREVEVTYGDSPRHRLDVAQEGSIEAIRKEQRQHRGRRVDY